MASCTLSLINKCVAPAARAEHLSFRRSTKVSAARTQKAVRSSKSSTLIVAKSDSSMDRRQVVNGFAALGLALATSLSTPDMASAICSGRDQDACDFEGSWSDPNHPDGFRTLVNGVKGYPTEGLLTGSDNKDGSEPFKIKYTVTGHDINIDFSVKGGPKDVPGKYEDGKIVFPDGNKWSRTSEEPTVQTSEEPIAP